MNMSSCIAAMNSMTAALSAQRALSAAAIRSSIVRLDAKQTKSGCAYGLEFPCVQLRNVKIILDAGQIPVKRYIGGDSDDLS